MSTAAIIFWTIMIGFMGGAITKYFTPELTQGDLFISMLYGLTGSVLFQYIGSLAHLYKFGEIQGLIASPIGAASFLIFYHYMHGPGQRRFK